MKILITGASGFIGSFLVEEALNKGYEVYAAIRSTSNKKYLSDSRIHFINLDFSDQELLTNVFSKFREEHGKFDYIIHNAGITKAKRKEEFFQVNYINSCNLIQALKASDCIPKKFVYISSLAAFGPRKDANLIKQTDTPNPITAYGQSKLNTEQFLFSLPDFPSLIIRPSAVYGPRDHEFYVLYRVLNNRIEPYIGLKNQLLSFIYVEDLAKITLTAMERMLFQNGIPRNSMAYFVSDGFVYTLQIFMNAAKKHLKKKTFRFSIPSILTKPLAFSVEQVSTLFGQTATFNRERLKEYQAFNWSCENIQIKKDLNFKPSYNLEVGMRKTIKWYKSNGLL